MPLAHEGAKDEGEVHRSGREFRVAGWDENKRGHTGRGAERVGEANGHGDTNVRTPSRRWTQAPRQQREGRVDLHHDVL